MVGSTYATFARFLLILHLSAYKHSMNEEIKDSPYPKQLPVFCSYLQLLLYTTLQVLHITKSFKVFKLVFFLWFQMMIWSSSPQKEWKNSNIISCAWDLSNIAFYSNEPFHCVAFTSHSFSLLVKLRLQIS